MHDASGLPLLPRYDLRQTERQVYHFLLPHPCARPLFYPVGQDGVVVVDDRRRAILVILVNVDVDDEEQDDALGRLPGALDQRRGRL